MRGMDLEKEKEKRALAGEKKVGVRRSSAGYITALSESVERSEPSGH